MKILEMEKLLFLVVLLGYGFFVYHIYLAVKNILQDYLKISNISDSSKSNSDSQKMSMYFSGVLAIWLIHQIARDVLREQPSLLLINRTTEPFKFLVSKLSELFVLIFVSAIVGLAIWGANNFIGDGRFKYAKTYFWTSLIIAGLFSILKIITPSF